MWVWGPSNPVTPRPRRRGGPRRAPEARGAPRGGTRSICRRGGVVTSDWGDGIYQLRDFTLSKFTWKDFSLSPPDPTDRPTDRWEPSEEETLSHPKLTLSPDLALSVLPLDPVRLSHLYTSLSPRPTSDVSLTCTRTPPSCRALSGYLPGCPPTRVGGRSSPHDPAGKSVGVSVNMRSMESA